VTPILGALHREFVFNRKGHESKPRTEWSAPVDLHEIESSHAELGYFPVKN
jgi:hypothetical protein